MGNPKRTPKLMMKIKKPQSRILINENDLVDESEIVEASIWLDCLVELRSDGRVVRLTEREIDVLIPWLARASEYLKSRE